MKEQVGAFAPLGVAGEFFARDCQVGVALDFNLQLYVPLGVGCWRLNAQCFPCRVPHSALHAEKLIQRLGVPLHDELVCARDADQRGTSPGTQDQGVIQDSRALQHCSATADSPENRNFEALTGGLIDLGGYLVAVSESDEGGRGLPKGEGFADFTGFSGIQ